MKNLFQRNRGVIQILGTLGFIFTLLLYYYGVHIPGNEKYVLEQDFRLLRTTGSGLTEKVTAFKNLTNSYASSKYNSELIIKNLKAKQIFDSCGPIKKLSGKDFFNLKSQQLEIDENNQIQFIGNDQKPESKNNLIAKIGLETFLNPVLSNQAFEGFFLVANNKILYDGTHLGLAKEDFIKSSGLEKKLFQSNDSLIEINGSRYRVFTMPLDLYSGNYQITIGGFVDEKNIQNQIKMVQPFILITLFFILTLAMLLMPFFKIWVLGKKDKLNLSDVTAVYITAFLLVAVFSLWFLYSGKSLFPKDKELAMQNDTLIKSVRAALEYELDSAKTLVKGYGFQDTVKTKNISTSLVVKNVFRVNESGFITRIGDLNSYKEKKTSTEFLLKTDLKDREYYKKVKSEPDSIAIEPIISRTDGRFEMVFAQKDTQKNCDTCFLEAISIIPKSISNAILPIDHQMAVVDKTGRVIMHTDNTRNMRENLINELKNGEELRQTLQLGVASIFDSRYYDKQCEIHAIPLKGYPDFSLVRIRDVTYWQHFKMDALMVTSTFLLCILFVVFLLSFCIYQFVTSGSIRKNGSLYLSWIYPKPTNGHLYKWMSFFGLVAVLCFLLVFMGPCRADGLYWFLVCWFLLAIPLFLAPLFSKKVLTFMDQLIRKIQAIFNSKSNKTTGQNEDKHKPIINPAKEEIIKSLKHPEVENNPIIEPPVGENNKTTDRSEGENKQNSNPVEVKKESKFFPVSNAYVRWYSFLIFLKLCYFSFLPACFFYRSSQDYFFQKYKENLLFDFASRWLERDTNPDIRSENHTVFGGGILISNHMSKVDSAENRSNAIYDFLEPGHLAAFNFDSMRQGTSKNLSMRYYPKVNNPQLFLTDHQISLEAKLNSMHFPVRDKAPWRWFWFYFLFAAGLGFIFLLVHQIIKKIFGIKTPDYAPFMHDEEKRMKFFLLNEDCKTNFIFLQGLTSSYKGNFIDNILSESDLGKNKNCYKIDMLNIPDRLEYENKELLQNWEDHLKPVFENASKIDILILKHFEYNYEDPHTNHIKLNLMERITQKTDWKVVITSAIEPTGLLEALENAGSINDNQKKILTEDISRWNVLLGKFVNVIVSIYRKEEDAKPKSFAFEMKSNEFLNGFKGVYEDIDSYSNLATNYAGDKNDAVLIDLHTLSIHFYRDIWHSLMPEEKVMLYDLAEEGLLNTSNYLTLFGLMRKGLIIKNNGVYFIMNHSFRHFILSSVSEKEMEKAENKIDENSIWRDYQGPILVVIAALLWFVLYANQEQFGQIFPVLTALAAGIPTLVKLFSYFIPGTVKG